MQPIKDGRFVKNRIVYDLLDACETMDLNSIAAGDYTNEERMQLAQLIGYSLYGYGELSYVTQDSYDAACLMNDGMTEDQAKIQVLEDTLLAVRCHLRRAACAVFQIHQDDLNA